MKATQTPSVNRRRGVRLLPVFCLTAVGIVITVALAAGHQGEQNNGQTVPGNKKAHLAVADPRPVAKAIETLEARHGWVITYEDQIYVHGDEVADVTAAVRKDLRKFRAGAAPKVLIPKGGSLAVDYDVEAHTNRPLDPAAVVLQLLDAHAAAGKGNVFRLERGGQTIHVIGSAFRNRAGHLIQQPAVLDAVLDAGVGGPSGYQTLESFCAAVSQANGARVVVGTIPLGLFTRPQELQAAGGQRARDVLLAVLDRVGGGARLSWQLFYDPGMQMYVLNIHEVSTPGD